MTKRKMLLKISSEAIEVVQSEIEELLLMVRPMRQRERWTMVVKRSSLLSGARYS